MDRKTSTRGERESPSFAPGEGTRWDRAFNAVAGHVQAYFRYALALIYLSFGALKLAGTSPVADLVARMLPFLAPGFAVGFVGAWEVAIGLAFLWRRSVRVALVLLILQLPGTFLPFFLAPEVCFTGHLFHLTLEGEFIVKNVLLVGATLLLGVSTAHPPRPTHPPAVS